MPPPIRQRDVHDLVTVDTVVNVREVQRALRHLDRALEREKRREMRGIATEARDDIRRPWTVGPSKGGHSFRAVTSGTRGLVPYVKLRRRHPRYPYVGWLLFGGIRRRRYRTGVRVDRRPREAPADGHWFYPGVKRTRPLARAAALRALSRSVRQAGLD